MVRPDALTLALSHGERESIVLAFICGDPSRTWIGERLSRQGLAFLPLPQGEGRGEGERTSPGACHMDVVRPLSTSPSWSA